ncbi:MAG: hypothetical protein WCK27_32910 [Verrucomicrobiota bacterium]
MLTAFDACEVYVFDCTGRPGIVLDRDRCGAGLKPILAVPLPEYLRHCFARRVLELEPLNPQQHTLASVKPLVSPVVEVSRHAPYNHIALGFVFAAPRTTDVVRAAAILARRGEPFGGQDIGIPGGFNVVPKQSDVRHGRVVFAEHQNSAAAGHWATN